MAFIVSCAIFIICAAYLIYIIWVSNHETKEKNEKIARLLKELDKRDATIKTMMDHIKNTEGKARKILASLERINW